MKSTTMKRSDQALEVKADSMGDPLCRAPEISLIIPTLNELENIKLLVPKLIETFKGVEWELIVVDDDSEDGTANYVKNLGATNARIRCHRRIGRRGLSGACIEGMLASQAEYVGVMDGDLQHDEGALRPMLEKARTGLDVVVAVREQNAASLAAMSQLRNKISKLCSAAAQHVLRIDLPDPGSGYFIARRTFVEEYADKISCNGFKLLFELLAASGPNVRVGQHLYTFSRRERGQSKANIDVGLEFVSSLVWHLTAGVISQTAIKFLLVGGLGVAVHLIILYALLSTTALIFSVCQFLSTALAATSNFILNNAFTFRADRLSGIRSVIGLGKYYSVIAVGAISNVGIAKWLFDSNFHFAVCGLAGAAVGSCWNYVVSKAIVWHVRK